MVALPAIRFIDQDCSRINLDISEISKMTKVIQSDPEILGGTPVFSGTRVPVQNLIEYLEAGETLDTFLDAFPSVSREQAIAVLELAREAIINRAHPA